MKFLFLVSISVALALVACEQRKEGAPVGSPIPPQEIEAQEFSPPRNISHVVVVRAAQDGSGRVDFTEVNQAANTSPQALAVDPRLQWESANTHLINQRVGYPEQDSNAWYFVQNPQTFEAPPQQSVGHGVFSWQAPVTRPYGYYHYPRYYGYPGHPYYHYYPQNYNAYANYYYQPAYFYNNAYWYYYQPYYNWYYNYYGTPYTYYFYRSWW